MCTLCSTPTRPFVGPGRLLAGPGASAGCADELRALGVLPTDGPVLLVADSAVLDLGLHRSAVSAARGRRLTGSCVGPGISAEPTPDIVRSLLPADGARVAAVVAIGGGSALDAAKLVSVALANALDLTAGLTPAADIVPGPPIVAVPTTAGTGAEATAVAMLWHDGGKRMFVHPHLVPRGRAHRSRAAARAAAIGDRVRWVRRHRPCRRVAAVDVPDPGHDQRPRARRSPCCPGRCRRRTSKGDLEARYGTALGAYQAGLALNASVVLGHSLAYAIASRTGLPHGVTVAMALPYCLAHARPACEDQIADMAEIVCGEADPELFVRWIVEHSRRMAIPTSLQELGVPREALPAMAADCVESYPRPNHPVADRPCRRPGAARTPVRR